MVHGLDRSGQRLWDRQFDLAVLSANGNGRTSGDSYGTYSTSLLEDVPSNVAPTVADVLVAPTNPYTADDLSVTYTFSDDDGDAESGTTVAWYLNGVHQPDRTGLTLPAAATAKGDAWHAAVTLQTVPTPEMRSPPARCRS